MEAWTKSKLLSIHTLGGLGLRWRRGPARGDVEAPSWRTSAARPASVVNDAAGCGDWCSAALLHRLGRLGPTGLGNATDDAIETAIRDAQAWASWNCRFFGARGGMVPPFVPLAPRDEPRIRPSTSLCPFCLQAPATAGVAEVVGDKASQ